MTTKEILDEYLQVVDEIFGLYFDATWGFHHNKIEIEKTQQDSILKFNITQEYIDATPMLFGVGDPNLDNSEVLHACTQKEFKIRNSDGGRNHLTLGNLCVTQLYQYWEDYYRAEIAKSVGLEKNDLKSDLFRDLNFLRRSIIHHRGIALNDIQKCTIITWFMPTETINFSKDQVNRLLALVKAEINNFKIEYCG